ncbi:MAG: ATPase, partial [Oscillospiraceae bacterium]
PYGMALLAAYRADRAPGEALEDYLNSRVFAHVSGRTVEPDAGDAAGFSAWLERYKALLDVERRAVEVL